MKSHMKRLNRVNKQRIMKWTIGDKWAVAHLSADVDVEDAAAVVAEAVECMWCLVGIPNPL